MKVITRFLSLTVSILLLLSPLSYAEVIKHASAEIPKEAYPLGLLKLALSYSSTPYTYEPTSEVETQGRQLGEVEAGDLSVMWAGTFKEIEQRLRPIKIPVFRGLLGHRIFIIRQGDQPRFSAIKTVDQLKQQITLGQGRFWADTQILEAAGFQVVPTTKYDGLFYMLDGGRFDAFPRGVHEPWVEIKDRKDLPLTVEKELMIIYPMPMYFFVAKDNAKLAEDIRSGLEKAIADGSFNEYFYNNPMIKDVLKNAHLKQRRAFRIDNPLLPPGTPLDRKELWFDYQKD